MYKFQTKPDSVCSIFGERSPPLIGIQIEGEESARKSIEKRRRQEIGIGWGGGKGARPVCQSLKQEKALWTDKHDICILYICMILFRKRAAFFSFFRWRGPTAEFYTYPQARFCLKMGRGEGERRYWALIKTRGIANLIHTATLS